MQRQLLLPGLEDWTGLELEDWTGQLMPTLAAKEVWSALTEAERRRIVGMLARMIAKVAIGETSDAAAQESNDE